MVSLIPYHNEGTVLYLMINGLTVLEVFSTASSEHSCLSLYIYHPTTIVTMYDYVPCAHLHDFPKLTLGIHI